MVNGRSEIVTLTNKPTDTNITLGENVNYATPTYGPATPQQQAKKMVPLPQRVEYRGSSLWHSLNLLI